MSKDFCFWRNISWTVFISSITDIVDPPRMELLVESWRFRTESHGTEYYLTIDLRVSIILQLVVLLLCSCNCTDGSPRGGANVGIGGGGGGGGGADVTVGGGPPTDERWRLWIEFWRKLGGFGLWGGSSYSVVSLLPSSSLEKDRLASEIFWLFCYTFFAEHYFFVEESGWDTLSFVVGLWRLMRNWLNILWRPNWDD